MNGWIHAGARARGQTYVIADGQTADGRRVGKELPLFFLSRSSTIEPEEARVHASALLSMLPGAAPHRQHSKVWWNERERETRLPVVGGDELAHGVALLGLTGDHPTALLPVDQPHLPMLHCGRVSRDRNKLRRNLFSNIIENEIRDTKKIKINKPMGASR